MKGEGIFGNALKVYIKGGRHFRKCLKGLYKRVNVESGRGH